MNVLPSRTVVAGIDVGGSRKGFHAVALRARKVVGTLASCDAREVAKWCTQIGAAAIGVDAPICWSRTGRARPAERALMECGIWCFSTPTKKIALQHSTNHYAWMLNGETIYAELGRESFHCFNGANTLRRPICFETFPHAITCDLMGRVVEARDKRTMRRALLSKSEVSCDRLTNIDFTDAALCALTADYFARQHFRKHGDPLEGYIVVPLRD